MADTTGFDESTVHETDASSGADEGRDALDDPYLDIIPLGRLNDGDIITKAGLARMLHRHQCTIDRMVARGELPPGTRWCGQQVWTVRVIREHIEARLAQEAEELGRTQERIEAHRP